MTSVFAAIDLGASSGRVILVRVSGSDEPSHQGRAPIAGGSRLELQEVHRFGNEPVHLPSGLHWDVLGLFQEILVGLRAARLALAPDEHLVGIGLDSWAVDYGLIDPGGALLGLPFCYRDGRTTEGVRAVHDRIDPEQLYAVNGLQFLPFNTLYQLAAERSVNREALNTGRARLALIPDLLGFWLTGKLVAERTNASTTGLLDVSTTQWNLPLAELLGLPPTALPELTDPGTVLGRLVPEVVAFTGLDPATPVIVVGSHDTASAVVGVPAEVGDFAYIACGTWSLVGVELSEPVLGDAGREAGFTNEGGVDSTVRYLHNVMGLWLLSESMRQWERDLHGVDLAAILAAAGDLPSGGPTFDVDDPVFLPPGDMPARIIAALAAAGVSVPDDPSDPTRGTDRVWLVRCILDSLARAYADTIEAAQRLTGRPIEQVHLVGGGTNNTLLCQLTATACGRPVLAGPVESTAIGNALVQARALGVLSGGLDDLRAVVRGSFALARYEPGR